MNIYIYSFINVYIYICYVYPCRHTLIKLYFNFSFLSEWDMVVETVFEPNGNIVFSV